jgi:hypothetical protein
MAETTIRKKIRRIPFEQFLTTRSDLLRTEMMATFLVSNLTEIEWYRPHMLFVEINGKNDAGKR